MGLLDKLFDKKICAICGGEIGMLGNRKLADGNLCKNCAAKLSPLMTDRRESTVAEIRRHLAYREQNARVLLGVNPTRVFGYGREKIYVDEPHGAFFISSERNYIPANPDVIGVGQVIGFRPTIREERTELYHHDPNGRQVPYVPPRYRVEYEFDVEIDVNSPYFSQIRFEFSADHPDSPRSDLYRTLQAELTALGEALNPANYVSSAPAAQSVPAEPAPAQPADGWLCACGQRNQGNFCTNCGAKRPVIRRCDKCGWMPEDQTRLPRFCPNCGDPFNENDVG